MITLSRSPFLFPFSAITQSDQTANPPQSRLPALDADVDSNAFIINLRHERFFSFGDGNRDAFAVDQSLALRVGARTDRKVRLIGERRKNGDRLDAQTLARLARIDPELLYPVKHRSAQAQVDLPVIRVRAGLVRARTGTGQHGTRVGEILWGATARLQCAKHESRESRRIKFGTATCIGTVAADD